MNTPVIAVIGLGYVGLPLAVAFSRHFPTLGFDQNPQRINELQQYFDRTGEVTSEELRALPLRYSADPATLKDCNTFIVAVPTPIDAYKRPDFGPLDKATRTVATMMPPAALVIYESTVYPGATEERCIPLLEQGSGKRCNWDFSVGYSPERINPGDRHHRLETIVKVTAGSNPQAAQQVAALYRKIVTAGVHEAPNIRVAEAAKVIENIQRDVNIALINELAILFHQLNLDSQDVLAAAQTKWNFLPFTPGLVGGHCIGVDPYYLTHKAHAVGFHPEMILAGRRINDAMGQHIAQRVIRLLALRPKPLTRAKILILGLTFKENCADLRNSRVIDLIRELTAYGLNIAVHDPIAHPTEALHEYAVPLIELPAPEPTFDAIILAVAHDVFRHRRWREWLHPEGVLFDVKGVLPRAEVDDRL